MKKNYLLNLTLTILGVGAFLLSNAQTVTTFSFTGGMQTFVVPAGVTSVDVDMIGASGGNSINGSAPGTLHIPGDGGRVQTTLAVTPGATLNIFVGGLGLDAVPGTGGTGGYNGGGDGGTQGTYNGGGGGGASDVRIGGTTFADRVVVAGGGGGTALNVFAGGDNGGAGGDLIGLDGEAGGGFNGYYGLGGTQSAGGAGGVYGAPYNDGMPGTFGLGGAGASGTSGGGGGAGYYGGGGASWAGGGGGSSYTDPVLATVTTHTQGINTGNGEVIITVLCVGLTTTVSSSLVCDGDFVTLTATSTSGGTITWDNGVIDGVPFAPPVGTTTYTATSSDGNDCGFSVDITSNALPTVVATVNSAIICFGDSIILTGTGANTYLWDNGAVDGVEFAPASSGLITYNVTGTDLNGCENTDAINVQVNQLVFTAVITNENTGGDGAIDLTVSGGTGSNTFVWSSGPTTEDISGLTAGTYTVSVDDGVCADDTTFTIINVAGIDHQSVSGLVIYPNPTKRYVNISLEGSFSYEVLNILGEIIISNQSVNSVLVDLSDLNRGAYFIRVISDNGEEVLKIIKQ